MYYARTARALIAGIKRQPCIYITIYAAFIHFSTGSNAELTDAPVNLFIILLERILKFFSYILD